ncbi:unnamed protein product [Moneuplotes crassus]|uniref:CUB domain-containing protein n=1 Tax=Euplotes crassus TaxID=5936 RepID=A0AAD1X202_EUPCR|nr:unnamed protein product [Moneuplotes crassus]
MDFPKIIKGVNFFGAIQRPKLSTILVCILIFIGICQCRRQLTATQCKSCLSAQNKKWCTQRVDFDNSRCCENDDESELCEGTGFYLCSSNIANSTADEAFSSEFSSNARSFLCPTDTAACGSQLQNISGLDQEGYFTSNEIPNSTVCWYKIEIPFNKVNTLQVNLHTANNCYLEVYRSTEVGNYTLEGEIYEGEEEEIWIGYIATAYILVVPLSSDSSQVSFTTKGTEVISSVETTTLWIILVALFVSIVAIGLISFSVMKYIRNCDQRRIPEQDQEARQQVYMDNDNSSTVYPNNRKQQEGREDISARNQKKIIEGHMRRAQVNQKSMIRLNNSEAGVQSQQMP